MSEKDLKNKPFPPKTRIVAIIQARMSSKRLPGKSLLDFAGASLVHRVIERVQRVQGIDAVILATSDDTSDDLLVDSLEMLPAGIIPTHLFRGDLHDVQKRFWDAALAAKADLIIRVTGDNPFIEPQLIEAMISRWQEHGGDYIACEECILGVGSELFTMKAFQKARQMTTSNYEREHVTPPFYQNENTFQTFRIPVPHFLKKDETIQLTVDTEGDYKRLSEIYETFYEGKPLSNEKIINHLRNCYAGSAK